MIVRFCLSVLITFICAIISISFYTLFERKALGYFQNRKGPNKVGLVGVPQPFADAIKLFSKESIFPNNANLVPFSISPIFSLLLRLFIWSLFPHMYPRLLNKFGVLAFLVVSRLAVYGTIVAGWSSNSKYALLGALRGVAQTISYEVSITLILLRPLIIYTCFNMNDFYRILLSIPIILFIPIFYIWVVSILAETNRTPFDFAEGESELVSGFNTEYRGFQFALLFIAEYTRIIIIRLFSASFFFHSLIGMIGRLGLIVGCVFISFIFIWVRASFPRIRYDKLINLAWKTFLPLSLAILFILCPLVILL